MLSDRQKPPEVTTPGVFSPFWQWLGYQSHRLVTDYSSPSNHLQMKWQTTPAATAIIKDKINSMGSTPFPYQSRGGNEFILS